MAFFLRWWSMKCSISILLLILLCVLAKASDEGIATCKQLCSDSTGVDDFVLRSNKCDCCYENQDLESLTARDWWLNQESITNDRYAWFRHRKPYEPIVGKDTVVAGVVYTFSAQTLKLTIMFPPLHPAESRSVTIVVKGVSSKVTRLARCTIKEHTWHCQARVDKLSHNTAYTFDVVYQPNPLLSNPWYHYDGIIPKQSGYPRIAAMGCFGKDSTMDKEELVKAVSSESADILILQGDQVYGADNLGYGALELIHSIHEITRVMPTIVQLDDHDYGQGNIWGAENSDEESGAGFTKPTCIVNALQDLSMGHLPDPHTKNTLSNGITIHYTNYRYGLVDFAILEARKFKNRFKGSSLLGSTQEQWLQEWCVSNRHRLRIILSQTPFASLATHNTNYRAGRVTSILTASIDTNGHPVAGRQRFMELIEDCSPLILSGDQHLGIAVTYEEYNVSEFASPAVVNDVFWRLNKQEWGQSYTDGFGNDYRLHAAWNLDPAVYNEFKSPLKSRNSRASVKQKRADGFMMVGLNGETATCEMHGYRTNHDVVWKVEVPCRSPVAGRKGFCFDACFIPEEQGWVCGQQMACAACEEAGVWCNSLCQKCPRDARVFRELSCTC